MAVALKATENGFFLFGWYLECAMHLFALFTGILISSCPARFEITLAAQFGLTESAFFLHE